ncbi:MAG TPA: GumC family protein, partial [Salinarimonas sp.]|nr:GumC family protein [Salinarimonas sp.]
MQTVDPMRLRAGLPLPQGDEAPPAGLDIGEALAALRRRWRGIALLGAVGLVVGLAVALALPPRFVAATQIAIDPRGLQVMDNEVTPRGLTQEGNAAILETQMRVLQSDLVLRKAVERERLGEDPEFNGDGGGLAARARGAVGAALGRAARPVDPELTALFTLRTRIRVQRAPGAYVVDLWVQSREAAKAARIAEAIARAFIEEQSSARREAARAASDALASRLDELRDRVTTAENAVEAFRSDNRIVGANGRLLNEQQLSDVSNQLVAARGRTGELRARFEQIQRIQRAGGVLDATFEVVQSPAIAGLRSRYSEIRRIEDDLVLKLGPRHPELTSVRAQAAGVQSQIAAEVNRIAASIRNDYERARANEEALERSVGAMGQESGTVNSRLVRLRELEREAQASRAIYENFLNRTRETREQGEIDTTNIRIISPARPPLEPVGIPSAVIAAVAAALGLTLGSVGALARHALDGRVHSARGLSARTGLPVLAVVPGRRRRSSLADAPPQALMRLHDRLAEGRRAAAPVLAVTAPDAGEQVAEVAL